LELIVERNIRRTAAAKLAVVTDPFFKKIGLPVQRYVFHEIERVLGVPNGRTLQLLEQSVGHVLYVRGHQIGIHADHPARNRLDDEVLFNADGVRDNLANCRVA